MQRLTARWIIPVDRPPLEWGEIEIDGERIHSVGPRSSNWEDDTHPVVNLGEAAILPGLVNAHTHLEFSDLQHPITTGSSFADWIDRVVARRRTALAHNDAVLRGYEESIASGVTTLGEIATSDDWRQLPNTTDAGVVFREIIGLKLDQWQSALESARRHLEVPHSSNWVRGLSPHAPYSVHSRLYEQLIDLAIAAGAPVAVHLAETQEELELLRHGRGPLVAQLKQFGAWEEGLIPLGSRVLDYLIPLVQVDRGLVIHGNYLTDEEIEFLARQPNLSVVYCPRTHAAFGHSPHPWLRLIDAGVRVALGTDSRASNPDLSLWSEVRFLKQHFPDIHAELLIRLATLNGAEALGCESNVGSLTEGKLANLLVLMPSEPSQQHNSVEMSALSLASIVGVMQTGRWVLDPQSTDASIT